MARLNLGKDERGAVYVEFLIAFLPLFLLFLATCQLTLIAAAEAVVRHAAYAAVRSAIVVLEDDPDRYDHAKRGDVQGGRANRMMGLNDVLTKLDIDTMRISNWYYVAGEFLSASTPQQGARMVPIRVAAYLPLVPLAPSQGLAEPQQETLERAIATVGDGQIGFAAEYTKAATSVTLHNSRDNEEPAVVPFEPSASVTTRVSYWFYCSVPWVRHLMCSGMLDGGMLRGGGDPAQTISKAKLLSLLGRGSRFKRLTASATLPNQGCPYCPREAQR